MTTDSDFELLLRSRTNASAFGVLYDRHSDAVHAYLARRVGTQTAEDLTSEVFLRALEARHRTRPHHSGTVLPWLYGIARNMVLKQSAPRQRELPEEPITSTQWDHVDARLDAVRQAPLLRTILDGLSPSEREVLLLVSWEELTLPEAAQVLGITAGAARTRLHRARAHASAALAQHSQSERNDHESR